MLTSLTQRDRLILDPEIRRSTVLSFINGATRTLFFTVFRCDEAEIARALADASTRGVDVRVLVSQRAKGAKRQLRSLTRFLGRRGVTVVRYDGPFTHYHAKYAVADGSRALVGSLNYTAECFSATADYLVETGDAQVVSTLTALFHHDTTMPWRIFKSETPRLIIGPEQARSRWRALIGSARANVRIADRKLNDPEIEAVIDAQMRRGVQVVRASRRAADGSRLHGKALVVDGQLGVVGSQALSRKSLDLRREVALVFEDARLVRALALHIDGLAATSARSLVTRRRAERAA